MITDQFSNYIFAVPAQYPLTPEGLEQELKDKLLGRWIKGEADRQEMKLVATAIVRKFLITYFQRKPAEAALGKCVVVRAGRVARNGLPIHGSVNFKLDPWFDDWLDAWED